ncbi:unnamed protein product [Arctia plantaginis]|uniref:Uncharacterized protein n=1 Tax=Arctia plantaginis TaxID=874455 RepID=A0A8S1BAH6_ARCPL|nr:unnamed protein product [Arctia plantaginis]
MSCGVRGLTTPSSALSRYGAQCGAGISSLVTMRRNSGSGATGLWRDAAAGAGRCGLEVVAWNLRRRRCLTPSALAHEARRRPLARSPTTPHLAASPPTCKSLNLHLRRITIYHQPLA